MYSQEITRKHRTAIVIAVDRSLSMREMIHSECGHSVSKADAVAYAVNSVISELVARATRDGEVRNYYDIAVLGYSAPVPEADAGCDCGIRYLLDGGRRFIPVSDLACAEPPVRKLVRRQMTVDGDIAVCEDDMPMWIEPCACGTTPMYEAFREIRNLLSDWCGNPANAGSFPPVVINITDGEASDCTSSELIDITSRIRGLKTDDGNVLLMNIHITARPASASLLFPTAAELDGSDRYAMLLAECSSRMPEAFNGWIDESRGCRGREGSPYLAIGYNTSPEGMFAMLSIGSRSVTGLQ